MTDDRPRSLFPNEQVAADRLASALEPFLAEVLISEERAAGLAPLLAHYVVASDWFDEQVRNGILHGKHIDAYETYALVSDLPGVREDVLGLLRDRDAEARQEWDDHRRAIGGQ